MRVWPTVLVRAGIEPDEEGGFVRLIGSSNFPFEDRSEGVGGKDHLDKQLALRDEWQLKTLRTAEMRLSELEEVRAKWTRAVVSLQSLRVSESPSLSTVRLASGGGTGGGGQAPGTMRLSQHHLDPSHSGAWPQAGRAMYIVAGSPPG